MATALDIIRLAMKDAGVLGTGQSISPDLSNDAFLTLGQMLAEWQRERFLVYATSQLVIPSTGAQSYTVGPGGNVDTTRPNEILFAFVRQVTGSPPVDTPLDILRSREEYDSITAKTIGSYPYLAYLDTAFPLASLYFWPVPPAAAYEMHVTVKHDFTMPTLISDDLTFPPEYESAIRYNLAQRIRMSNDLPPKPQLDALAKSTKQTLREANAQIPTLAVPASLVNRRSRFNIYTGH